MQRVKSKKTTSKQQYYLYGKHTCLEAIQNPRRKIKYIFCTSSILSNYQSIIQNYQYIVKTGLELDNILGSNINHQGIVIQTQPLSNKIEDINLQKTKSLIVILDRVQDPTNLGGIIRNAAAFGADAIITTNKNAVTLTSTSARIASGALEKIPVISIANINNIISLLKQYGYWVIGLEGRAKSNLDLKYFTSKTVIILGSESSGIKELIKKKCDYLLKIPMKNMESINVSCASAIACYLYQLACK